MTLLDLLMKESDPSGDESDPSYLEEPSEDAKPEDAQPQQQQAPGSAPAAAAPPPAPQPQPTFNLAAYRYLPSR